MTDGTPAGLRVLHDFSSLRRWGGMLRVFANLAPRLNSLDIGQYLFARVDGMSPMSAPVVDSLAQPPGMDYAWGPIPLPRFPPALRRWRRRALARPLQLDAILNWGRFGNHDALWLAGELGARAYYWEHGAAWTKSRKPGAGFLGGFDGAIAVSESARVMLTERWGFRSPIKVIHNAVWDEGRHEPAPGRQHEGGPMRIGFAGRMVAFKGAAVALHTLASVRAAGLDARLDLAGDGPDLESLKALARKLGVSDHAGFRGYVADMESWYRQIDVLLHPALREPFGLIAAEAMCWGAPVVTVAVDGLAEVVRNEVDGYCVVPTLPLSDAESLGFAVADVPELVFHAAEGRLGAPRIADPAILSKALQKLAQPGELARFSLAVAPAARQRFALGLQAQAVAGVLRGGAGT